MVWMQAQEMCAYPSRRTDSNCVDLASAMLACDAVFAVRCSGSWLQLMIFAASIAGAEHTYMHCPYARSNKLLARFAFFLGHTACALSSSCCNI